MLVEDGLTYDTLRGVHTAIDVIREMALEPGMHAVATVKATNVTIELPG